jgi:hypothetical protein
MCIYYKLFYPNLDIKMLAQYIGVNILANTFVYFSPTFAGHSLLQNMALALFSMVRARGFLYAPILFEKRTPMGSAKQSRYKREREGAAAAEAESFIWKKKK